jgi:hypothetical protein
MVTLLWSLETPQQHEEWERRMKSDNPGPPGLDLQLAVRQITPLAFHQFLMLSDATPDAILRFARRWGVLTLCRTHYLPGSHSPECGASSVREEAGRYAWEPLSAWRHFAREARVTLQLAGAVRARDVARSIELSNELSEIGHNRPEPDVRRRLIPPPNETEQLSVTEFWTLFASVLADRGREFEKLPSDEERWAQFTKDCAVEFGVSLELAEGKLREFLRALPGQIEMHNEMVSWSDKRMNQFKMEGVANSLAHTVNEWLEMGAVRPSMRYQHGQPIVSFRAGHADVDALFGALATQLMLAVTSIEGLAVCNGCGTPYEPDRRPAVGKRHYCLRCGPRVAQRDASRAYRERQRKTKVRSSGRRRRQS